jgi:hypothetical protein
VLPQIEGKSVNKKELEHEMQQILSQIECLKPFISYVKDCQEMIESYVYQAEYHSSLSAEHSLVCWELHQAFYNYLTPLTID